MLLAPIRRLAIVLILPVMTTGLGGCSALVADLVMLPFHVAGEAVEFAMEDRSSYGLLWLRRNSRNQDHGLLPRSIAGAWPTRCTAPPPRSANVHLVFSRSPRPSTTRSSQRRRGPIAPRRRADGSIGHPPKPAPTVTRLSPSRTMKREPASFPCAPRCDLASTWLKEQVELRPDVASMAERLEITGVDHHIRLARTASHS